MLTVSHRQHFPGKWTLINETLSRVYNLNEKENTREEWTEQTDGVKPGVRAVRKSERKATAYQTQSELYIAMKVWPWAWENSRFYMYKYVFLFDCFSYCAYTYLACFAG